MDVTTSARADASSSARLWFALLGGMAAYALHLLVGFWVVPAACGADAEGAVPWAVTGATVVSAAVAVAATVVAVRVRRALGASRRPADPAAGDASVPRAWDVAPGSSTAQFMATAGVVLNPLALLVVLVAGIPLLLVSPCA